jgi:hypothetical protein
VNYEGKATHSEGTLTLDGKDQPNPTANDETIAAVRVDTYTISGVFKKAGKEIGSRKEVVSQDGKTITRTQRRKDEKGQDITRISIYDKQ